MVSAAESGNLERVQQLLKSGAPINQGDDHRFGWTPLIAAIYGNQTNVIHYLVKAGADVNLPSADGSTPMMWEAAYGDRGIGVTKYLIDHGAKLDAKDKNGETVFDRAKSLPPKPKLLEVLDAAKRGYPQKVSPNP